MEKDIKGTLLRIASEMLKRGPGFAQERAVLQAARKELKPDTTQSEQKILDVWHSLFTEGCLSWGYNLDNPREPFFHIPEIRDQNAA